MATHRPLQKMAIKATTTNFTNWKNSCNIGTRVYRTIGYNYIVNMNKRKFIM